MTLKRSFSPSDVAFGGLNSNEELQGKRIRSEGGREEEPMVSSSEMPKLKGRSRESIGEIGIKQSYSPIEEATTERRERGRESARKKGRRSDHRLERGQHFG